MSSTRSTCEVNVREYPKGRGITFIPFKKMICKSTRIVDEDIHL
jgi:hypothetical protein